MKILDQIIKRIKNLSFEKQEKLLDILKEWQQGKEREFKRLNRRSEVAVAGTNRVIQTDMRDISGSGVYINTSGKFAMDERVRVVFTVPDFEKPFKLQGKIVRVEQQGMAIKFEDITPYFKTILDDAIWKNQSEYKNSSK
ncbi:MAG: PilZ domain-containing protein [Desulfobacula sp.]|nr:PilZ domain-containing protein [Desulfobacula sp.]